MSWVPADDGGVQLRSYDIRVKKEVADKRANSRRVEWETISFDSISAEKHSYPVGGLSEGETYQIQVTLEDFNNLLNFVEGIFTRTHTSHYCVMTSLFKGNF